MATKFKEGDRVIVVAGWFNDRIPRTICDVGWQNGKPCYHTITDGDLNSCGPWFEDDELEATDIPWSNPWARSPEAQP